jgi:hypothetical protein
MLYLRYLYLSIVVSNTYCVSHVANSGAYNIKLPEEYVSHKL